MDVGNIASVLTLLVFLVVNIAPQIQNWLQAQSLIKKQSVQDKIEQANSEVGVAEKYVGIGISQAKMMQDVYARCVEDNECLKDENQELQKKVFDFTGKLIRANIVVRSMRAEISSIIAEQGQKQSTLQRAIYAKLVNIMQIADEYIRDSDLQDDNEKKD